MLCICCAMILSTHAQSSHDLSSDTVLVASQLRDSALHDRFAYEFSRHFRYRRPMPYSWNA